MEFITRLGQKKNRDFFGNFFWGDDTHPSPPWGTTPPGSPWGTTPPPCRAIFFLKKYIFSMIFFLKHAHMEFITRLGQKKTRFFGNFFPGDYPPCSPTPWGLHPPCSPPGGLHPPAAPPPRGTSPPCRAIFFSQFFFLN